MSVPDAASVKPPVHSGQRTLKITKAVPSGYPCVCNLDDPDDMSVLALTHVTKPTADDPDE